MWPLQKAETVSYNSLSTQCITKWLSEKAVFLLLLRKGVATEIPGQELPEIIAQGYP